MGQGKGPGGSWLLPQEKVPNFKRRKETARKASPLSPENGLGLPAPLRFLVPGRQEPFSLFFSSLWPPSSPTLLGLLFYANAVRQRHGGRKIPGVFSQKRKSMWSHQSGPGPAASQGSGRGQIGTSSFPQQPHLWPMELNHSQARLSQSHGSAQGGTGDNHWLWHCLPWGYAVPSQHDESWSVGPALFCPGIKQPLVSLPVTPWTQLLPLVSLNSSPAQGPHVCQ